MPVERHAGRASKACTACRKQKTRCYETRLGTCLRCTTLKLQCSLRSEGPAREEGYGAGRSRSREIEPTSDTPAIKDDRLTALENTVARLTRRLSAIERPRKDHLQASQLPALPPDDEQHPAPVVLLRHVADEVGGSPELGRLVQSRSASSSVDLINRGIITYDTAASLIAMFLEHYGRWVAINQEVPLDLAMEQLRCSPLLFCAACLIAVRHLDAVMAATLTDPLFQEAKRLMSDAMLTVPQGLDFFRAAVILSFWSTTIGTTPLSLDSWLLSGIALQHCTTSGFSQVLPSSKSTSKSRQDDKMLAARRNVWNHLCLSHLHYCVGTRRRASIDRQQIDECHLVLGSDHATNFEHRIVAEIELYWIIYEYCCKQSMELPRVQASLKSWREEWAFLFSQPRSTFLQMGLYFAQLLAYDQSMKVRSVAVRESLLAEMIRSSTAILSLAMSTTDERTKHLSDHIYHLIAYAAVTICRLLHKYERQIELSHDLHELDETVMRVVTWLHCVGPACHVANTFGDIVAALHKKLRPDASVVSPTLSYQEADPMYHAEFASLFPDLVPFGSDNGPMPDLLPDWQAFSHDHE